MSGFFRALALLIAIACAVWVGVLWRWQATQRDMSVQDIATYLVALPLTLFALALLARWAWRGAAARAALRAASAAAGAASATSATASAEGASATGPGAPGAMPLLVLSAQVHCAAGSSTQAVLAAAAEGQPRPQLDPELVNDDGMPLLTARITALDLDAVDLGVALADARALRPAWAEAEVEDTTLRALAALVLPLQACLSDLQPWRQRFGQVDASTAPFEPFEPFGPIEPRGPVSPVMPVTSFQPPGAFAPLAPAGPAGWVPRRNVVLRVLPSWPADWPAFDAAVATAWLKREIAVAEVAAPDRIAFANTPAGETADSGGGAACWLEAERLMRMLAHDGHADVLLLTACHSAIGAQAVQRLQAARQLFTARSPKQPLPGEAAAVLALAPVAWAAPDGAGLPDPAADAPPLAMLHRAAVSRRDQAVDAPGRASAQAAQACIAQALAAGAMAVAHAGAHAAANPTASSATHAAANPFPNAGSTLATDAGAAIHDADQHTARSAEALTALLHCLPQLQPADDVVQTGALNGQLGVAAVPLVIALAAAQAQALQQPCLALSVDDALTRLALLARPVVAAPAEAAPPAAATAPAPAAA